MSSSQTKKTPRTNKKKASNLPSLNLPPPNTQSPNLQSSTLPSPPCYRPLFDQPIHSSFKKLNSFFNLNHKVIFNPNHAAYSTRQMILPMKAPLKISFKIHFKSPKSNHKKYHNPNSLYSKWRTVNRVAMEFNDIYLNTICNPQSGATEVDVMAKVRQIYKAKVGITFSNESFWGVMKSNRKCLNLKSHDDYAGMSKRSKTSESTHIQYSYECIEGIDFNNDKSYEAPTCHISYGMRQSKKESSKVLKSHRLKWRISEGWIISLMLSWKWEKKKERNVY
ncbi:unnamed protein product [Lactuca saligna]|uniref:Uncharacterized protein n=1 Tax=Lactuca saligna TaxID=75948 RepID=A0AA35ZAM5_LACSI|nr:unnamed protein product [Lactuca saligna]